jgi:hydrogenase/urease accessory protein HupE
MLRIMAIVLLILYSQPQVLADEIRPAYLQISEKSPHLFSLLWKVPAKGNKKLSLDVILPTNCTNKSQPRRQLVNSAYIERWMSVCEGGLAEQTITIKGLGTSNTDVLVHLEFLDNTSQSVQLTPVNNSYTVNATASSWQIVRTYTWLGITHILLGFDHILFVFALLLIVKNMRRLLWTITAFTLAHSITMAGATLGLVQLPQQPVEAIIALSILFLAMEIIHEKQGKIGLASRFPWIIAFIFGLLHGFGFAGALAEIGLPQQAITLALIFFNIGVELGQIMFVSAVVLLNYILQNFKHPKLQEKVEMVVVYGIGGLSTFWFIERVSSF